jgi:hypothetical protein
MTMRYVIHWSMDCCDRDGKIVIDDPQEVKECDEMTDEQRSSHFQELVDEEVRINGPSGFVDSVDVED